MWNKVQDFYNNNKHAIIWTACYIFAAWAIMRYMFNFNIFSATRWHQLFHSHLYGFAGFVFSILILAMVPLYIATTVIIARTKTPLFNINITIPEFIKTFIKNAFIQTPMPDEEPVATTVPTNESEQETPTEQIPSTENTETPTETTSPTPIPDTVPAELRVAYMRARDNVLYTQKSAFDLANTTRAPDPAPIAEPTGADATPMEDFAIPTDFDITDTDSIMGNVPTFTDIDLDADIDDDADEQTPEITDIKTPNNENQDVINYLNKKSVPCEIIDDIVVTDKFAIASHTDSDFWVADNESWFAAGKIRKSPIVSVLNVAKQRNVQPVLYLAYDNIMDIDELRTGWQDAGIHVINNLDELK